MKRLLLTILSVIAFAGITVAQDVIYSSGNYTTPSGRQGAGIYVNGTFAISLGEPSTGYYHQSADVDVYDGDIYWVCWEKSFLKEFKYRDYSNKVLVLKNEQQYPTKFEDKYTYNEKGERIKKYFIRVKTQNFNKLKANTEYFISWIYNYEMPKDNILFWIPFKGNIEVEFLGLV